MYILLLEKCNKIQIIIIQFGWYYIEVRILDKKFLNQLCFNLRIKLMTIKSDFFIFLVDGNILSICVLQ